MAGLRRSRRRNCSLQLQSQGASIGACVTERRLRIGVRTGNPAMIVAFSKDSFMFLVAMSSVVQCAAVR
jgi:hypothetical protein